MGTETIYLDLGDLYLPRVHEQVAAQGPFPAKLVWFPLRGTM